MKIVHIEDFFHPHAGYQVNILAKFMAKEGHDVTIITSELDKVGESLTQFFGKDNVEQADREYEKQYNVKIFRLPLRAYVSGRAIYKCHVIWKMLDEIKPDVLYVHGSDTYIAIRVFLRAKRMKCTIVSDNHMVDMASFNKFRSVFRLFYKMCITPIIKKRQIPIIRTADVNYIMNRFGIPSELAPLVSLGTDTMLFYQNEEIRKEFRKENNISQDALVVLYAGKLDQSKGGMLLAELTTQTIDSNREIVFVIIGNAVGTYGEDVEKLFAKSKHRVIRFKTQQYANLARYYQSADIAVIPAACSLSIFDFAAAGLPVVVEDNETNLLRIKVLGEGSAFKSGDVKDFANTVAGYAMMNSQSLYTAKEKISENAKQKYGYDKQYDKYMKVIEEAIQCQTTKA